MKAKLKRFFGFFKMSNLKREVRTLGFEITGKNVMILALVLLFAAFVSGYLLRLDYAYCGILAIFFVACMPSMIITRFKADYEKNRFNDIIDYMEQLIYSFHKNNKIREALIDVHEVARGNVRDTVERMLDFLDRNMKTANLYEGALNIMQEEYNCSRLQLLHNYLIEVEKNGGESERSLNMLLTDIRGWSERVLVYQQERKNIKSKITLSIFLAMLSCGFMVNLIPEEYVDKIVAMPAYQIGTLIVLLCCIALYVVASNKIGVSYLDFETDAETSASALNSMNYIRTYNRTNHIKPALIKVGLLLPFLIISIYAKIYWLVAPLAVMTFMLAFSDYAKKNASVRAVVREVNKMFPAWIRSLVLYLQTENVHMAIKKSLRTAPPILRGEIEDFLMDLDEDPSSIRPYKEFLKSFDVPQLKMSIHYLYSIAQFGTSDMLAQLDYLVEQNSQLSLNEEKLRNEDSLAGFGVMTLLPMLFAVIKLIIDLVLFLNIFTGYMSSFGTIPTL